MTEESSFVTQMRATLQARIDDLSPLVAEAQKLRHAKDLLDGTVPSVPGSRRRGRPDRSAPRGTQAVKEIVERPGQTTSAIARAIGAHPNYMHRILPQMAEQGIIERRDSGWHPATTAPTSVENETSGEPAG